MATMEAMEAMRDVIHGARLVSPGREIRNGALVIEGGRITEVLEDPAALPAADHHLDAGGRLLLPGFIDIHAHGALGDDVCDGTPEAISRIARAKLAEGVTTWLPTTLTQPADALAEILAACAAYLAEPEFCRVPGVHLEGPFIARAMAGAQNPEHVRPPDVAELRRLHGICPIRLLSLAPELPGAMDLIRAARGMGMTVSAAHTAATFGEVTAAADAGLTHLTHFGNAMTPLHHRAPGVVGAGLADERLQLELIADGVHLAPEMIRLVFKLVAGDRLMLITDSMAASGMSDGTLRLGGLDVTVRGGVARLASNDALAGSTLAFHRGLANVVALTGLPLARLVATTSWNQARSLGLGGLGKLEPGFLADLVILDEDFSVWKTWVAGEERT